MAAHTDATLGAKKAAKPGAKVGKRANSEADPKKFHRTEATGYTPPATRAASVANAAEFDKDSPPAPAPARTRLRGIRLAPRAEIDDLVARYSAVLTTLQSAAALDENGHDVSLTLRDSRNGRNPVCMMKTIGPFTDDQVTDADDLDDQDDDS